MTVIAAGGDGDIYGEGGNHFLHAIRRNSDITNIVHNNMLYCLTKKQASPSSLFGLVTPVQVHGVTEETFNPISVAISLNATFVARAYCADVDQTKEIFKKAISHKGYALVDVLMPCITFEVSSFKTLKERTYYLENSHNVTDRVEAFKRALEMGDRIPLGIFYARESVNTFEDNQMVYKDDKTPLAYREISRGNLLKELIKTKKD